MIMNHTHNMTSALMYPFDMATIHNSSQPVAKTTELSTVDYISILIYSCVFIIGVTGNILVCLFFKIDNHRMKHIQIIFYLAISDLCASITNPFLFIYLTVNQFSTWDFGLVGCKLLPLTWRSFTSISLGIIMVINIDRCIALKFPFRNPIPKKRINMIVLFIIVLSIVMELPYLIYAKIKVSPGGSKICNVPSVKVHGYAYPVISIMLIRDSLYLTVFLVTFIVIKRELNIKKNVGQNLPHLQNQARLKENHRVLKMLLLVATAFVVSVFPRELLHIVYTLTWMTPGKGIILTASLRKVNSILTAMMCCNTIYNIIIYAKLQRKFRKSVFDTFFSIAKPRKKQTSGSVRSYLSTRQRLLSSFNGGTTSTVD
ncbi:type-1 angiotensin II receptor B-like [Clytia hemisphaerica]|uniref:type-1 angiotensin II receptor B-like n=1 Tax=Clytia hemisphaerica TaxID=252671 RepID=UPI0034D4D385